MDVSFYTAAVGAQQQQFRMDIQANNLSNTNNDRFRARKVAFSTLMTNRVPSVLEDEPVIRGVGAKLESAESDPRSDQYKPTDRALDYAIDGDGFFALYDPATGQYTYTRDGAFTVVDFVRKEPPPGGLIEVPVTHWYLSDGNGRFVLDSTGVNWVEITQEVDVIRMGDILDIGIFDFQNYNGMVSVGDNRFRPVDKNGNVFIARNSKLMQGFLETSNVDVAYEFVKVIEAQRTFSFLLRMVQTSDEITTTVNNLR